MRILDGAMGSELSARGLPLDLPGWSAHALELSPASVAELHAEYAAAGATVHTANTFRTQPRAIGRRWEELARRAVAIARSQVGGGVVAASMAPIADCYRPDLAPPSAEARAEHRAIAAALADAGADLLLCETFASPREALIAVEEAVRTGKETWLALSPGPDGALLDPSTLAETAARAVGAGARAVLVSCVGVARVPAYLEPLAERARALGVAFGAYANAFGDLATTPEQYAAHARDWMTRGATIVGGCCGTGPAHIAAVAAMPRDQNLGCAPFTSTRPK